MKSKLLIILVAVLSIITLSSCIKISNSKFHFYTSKYKNEVKLSGVDTTITKKWSNYDKIKISGDISIVYRKGNENTIVIKGDTALTSLISIEEDNDKGNRVINLNSNYNGYLEDSVIPSVIITTDSITDIYLKGAPSIIFEGNFYSNKNISISCDGTSSLEGLNLQTSRLSLECSGAASFSNVNIVADSSISLKSKGACSFAPINIKSSDAKIEMLGSSSFQSNVDISNKLVITSKGASSIELLGKTNNIDCLSKGASSVDISDLKISGNKKIETEGVSSVSEPR